MKKIFQTISTSKRMLMILLVCLLTVSCNATTNNSNSSSSVKTKNTEVLKMKLTAIKDPVVTKGDAIIFLLPDGWKQQSQINWDMQNNVYPSNPEAHISNPENTVRFSSYPTQFYMLVTPTMSMSGFGVGSKYLGAQVVGSMPASTTAAAKQVLDKLNCLPAGTTITNTKVTKIPATNPADIHAQKANPQAIFINDNVYQEGKCIINGQNYIVVVNTVVSGMVNQSLGFANWQVRPDVFIVKDDANKDKNGEILRCVYKSFRATPNYQQCIMQTVKILSDQFYSGVRAAGEISKQISRNNDAMIASIDAQYKKANTPTSSTNGRSSNDDFSQYIRGVETYSDSYGTSYELPSYYSNAWKNSSGEIILTNEAGYNPNVGSTLTWEELKK